MPRVASRLAAVVAWLGASGLGAPARAAPLDPIDYDAPNPNRGVLDHARTVANFTFGNYVVFQVDWFRGVYWIYDTRSSIGQVVKSPWGFDYDPLQENLLSHPLHGALDFTAGRAAGLSFWESAAYTPLGALEWNLFAERQLVYPGGWRSKPSINDFVSTSTSGILLGEVLYRLSSAILDDSSAGSERLLREIGAGIVSPMRGFDRLYTGRAWESGAPPERAHPVRLAVEGGVDRLRTGGGHPPAALLAAEVLYGDLRPRPGRDHFDPFEFFWAYGAVNFAQSQLSGAQVYAQGLLAGWSSPMGSADDDAEPRHNQVIGFVQNFDYQGANVAQYGAMSVGFGDYLTWRWGPRRMLRLGADVDWTYLAAAASPLASADREGYAYAMGAAIGISGRAELGRWGHLGFRSRNYVTAVVDGQGREEAIGYGRLAYDVDVVPHLGVGASPIVIYRHSTSGAAHVDALSLVTQVYVRVEN